ncbi:MAG: HEPN domain-containing protein [Candidatus Magnetomorum sp.]|nr:HEPN domain-containing protein [Candidatus Magnetomorum sp.]
MVVEKVLKAIYVRDKNKVPPKTHNLIRLAQSTTLNFPEEKMLQLDRINDFNMEARYPDDKLSFYKTCNEEFTKENLEIIKEMYNWLNSQIQLPT